MRLAWFAPETSDVALELGGSHVVDHFDERRAHEFVWRHFREPYDLTIFELGDASDRAFVWPYVFHYPGIVVLGAASLQRSRSHWLRLAQRHHDLRVERSFSGWTFLRAPLDASRMVVVHDAALARELVEAFPSVAVRCVPVGATPAVVTPAEGTGRFVIAGSDHGVVERAAVRAREFGAQVALAGRSAGLNENDVLVALEWPAATAPSSAALRAMAAGVPAIVLETESVATWPTLDPQTWQPRGYLGSGTPIAISIDPRDQEHSLMLAMRRLSADATLRTSLGAAARRWAHEHANAAIAAAAWEPILGEATQLAPLATAGNLPAHLTDDGIAAARTILSELGTTVDFL